MNKSFFIIACLLVSLLSLRVSADEFDDAVSAYERGDYEIALTGFRRAADRGDFSGQFNLGVMYGQGRGVTQDDRKAVKWFRRAAEQGLAQAQFSLGVMYALGRGVTQDNSKAIKWLSRAAEQGFAKAQSELDRMRANGVGVAKDYNKVFFHQLDASCKKGTLADFERDSRYRAMTSELEYFGGRYFYKKSKNMVVYDVFGQMKPVKKEFFFDPTLHDVAADYNVKEYYILIDGILTCYVRTNDGFLDYAFIKTSNTSVNIFDDGQSFPRGGAASLNSDLNGFVYHFSETAGDNIEPGQLSMQFYMHNGIRNDKPAYINDDLN